MRIDSEEYDDFRDMVHVVSAACPKLVNRLTKVPETREQVLRQIQDVRMTMDLMLRFADRARKSVEGKEVQVEHRQGNVERPGH